jgi:hypothetical protein
LQAFFDHTLDIGSLAVGYRHDVGAASKRIIVPDRLGPQREATARGDEDSRELSVFHGSILSLG